jgi:hypothetical protein
VIGDVIAAGSGGCFDLELVGPEIEREGYEPAVTRAVARLSALLAAAGA